MKLRISPALLLVALLLSTTSAAEPVAPVSEEIRVAVYDDVGTGRSKVQLMAALESAKHFRIEKVTAEEIRDGGLDGFDVVIHPGGSGSKQGKQLDEAGREAVREFIRRGGGYVGFCAGAYLASADYPWSLHILDAKVLDRAHWARGTGTVRVGLTDEGQKVLQVESPQVEIYYGQGPLLAPAGKADLPDYVTLGSYETEIAKKGAPSGVMIGTTAIAAAPFGQGRVFCFSPHPEKTDGLDAFVHRAVEYAAGVGQTD